MKGRDYKEEILKILKNHGGCVTGFNNLQRIGKFHSTSLLNNLEELEAQNKINIKKSKIGIMWSKFCIIKKHFGFKLKINDLEINKIRKLKDENSTYEEKLFLNTCIIRISFNKCKNLILGDLASKLLDDYPMDKKELRYSKEHYFLVMANELNELRESDRRRIINSLYEENPEKVILHEIKIRKTA